MSALDTSQAPDAPIRPAVGAGTRSTGAGAAVLRAFDLLYRVVARVNAACIAVACVLIGLIALLTLWEAITRYFFRQPATWTYPVTSYMLVFSIYLALGYTLQKGGHVSVDFVVEMVSPGVQRWLDRLGHVLGLAFVLVCLIQTYRVTARQVAEGQHDISALSLPLGPISAALPIGLAFMAVTYALVLVDSFIHPPGEPTRQDLERGKQGALVTPD